MKKRQFVQGETHDAKFKSIENVLRKMSNKMKTVVYFNVPPSLLTDRVEIELGKGHGQWLLPVDGEIRQGSIRLFSPSIKTGQIKLSCGDGVRVTTVTHTIPKRGSAFGQNFQFKCAEGDILDMDINLTYEEETDEAAYALVAIAFFANSTATAENKLAISEVLGEEE